MIAGDLPGMISGYLEERYQADGAVFLWTSGAAANQNPIFFSRYQRYEHDKTHGLSYSIGYGVWTLCRHRYMYPFSSFPHVLQHTDHIHSLSFR